jgi:hypothetical protein
MYTTGVDEYDEYGDPLDALTLLIDQGWKGPRLVVVKSGAGWGVSLLDSARNQLLPFAKEPTFTVAWMFGASNVTALVAREAAGQVPRLEETGSVNATLVAAERIGVAEGSFRDWTEVTATADTGYSRCHLVVWDLGAEWEEYNYLGMATGAPCGTPTESLEPGEYLFTVWATEGWWGPALGPTPYGRVTITASDG